MRKQYKKKRRSCALCKPHKTGGANRWTAKEGALMKQVVREMREVCR